MQLLDAQSPGHRPKERRSNGGCHRGWASALALAALTLAAATACPGHQEADGTTTEPPAPTAATASPGTSTPSASNLLDDPAAAVDFGRKPWAAKSRAVILAYAAAEQGWVKARLAPADPDHPSLLTTQTGAVLDNRQRVVRANYRDKGEALKPPIVFSIYPHSANYDDDTASLELCMTQEIPQYETRTGKVTDDDLFSEDIRAEMKYVDGRWLLSARETVGEVKDGRSCAAI